MEQNLRKKNQQQKSSKQIISIGWANQNTKIYGKTYARKKEIK